MDFKKKIKEWFSTNSSNDIRIAIVGNVSSGKSYLIADIIQVLRSLRDYGGGSIIRFSPKDHGIGPADQTKVYGVRKNDYYEYKIRGCNKKIQILDMPGEAFDSETTDVFYLLFDKLIGSSVEFKKLDGKKREKVKLEAEEPENISILYYGDIDDKSEKTGQIDKSNYISYYSTKELLDYYSEKYEFDLSSSKIVSVENILKDFFDYDIDSLMSAIYDSKILGDDNEYFKENMSKMFFWFYALLSTDLVFCRMIAAPDGKEDNDDNGAVLNDLFDMARTNFSLDDIKKNVYLVYRGFDLILEQKILKEKKDGIENKLRSIGINCNDYGLIHDGVYAEIAHHFLRYLNNNCKVEPPKIIKSEGFAFNVRGKFKCTDKDNVRLFLNHEIYTDFDKFYRDTYPVDGVCPNVFFTTSAIDIQYNIHQNAQDNKSKFINVGVFDINDNGVENRLCFGARQLLICILSKYMVIEEFESLKRCGEVLKEINKNQNQNPKIIFTEKLFSMLGYNSNND